jgi:hypothetical protein
MKIIIVEDLSRGYRTIKKVIHLTGRESSFPRDCHDMLTEVMGKREEARWILDEVLERSKKGQGSG